MTAPFLLLILIDSIPRNPTAQGALLASSLRDLVCPPFETHATMSLSPPNRSPAYEVLALRCLVSEPCAVYDWHSHPFYEFSFVSDDDATIGHPPGVRAVKRNTLLFYHPEEKHAGWSGPNQRPRFWVLHFSVDPADLKSLPHLREPDPAHRLWTLSTEQADGFRWLFLQILNERTLGYRNQSQAEAAWLKLLMIAIDRWRAGSNFDLPTPDSVSPELVKLWHLINASVGQPTEYQRRIHSLPNYDSLRHAFKRAFGCSPREMMLRLRVQHAQSLLLESKLSIKEIASRCGYERQHEFTRAFSRLTGASPSAWRINPSARLASRPSRKINDQDAS